MGSSLALSLGLRLLPYAAVVATAGWIYLQGKWDSEQKAELAEARATIEVLHESTRRTNLANELASQAANRRAVRERELQSKVDNYEDALKARGTAGCLLDDADVNSLRGIQ